MTDEKTLIERLIDPLPAALWAAIGAVLMQGWRRYRGRMLTLRWQAFHQPLAISAEDTYFGTIEVRYNGEPVQNLFFTTIDIQNESNTDLVGLDLNFIFNDGTMIRISHGAVQRSANSLPFAAPFATELARFVQLPQDNPQRPPLAAALARRRDYRVPTLNRGSTVRVGMLVQGQPGKQPVIDLASDHPGLRLVFQPPRPLLFGVNHNVAALTGVLAGIAVIVGLSLTSVGRIAGMALSFAIGCVTAVLGVLVVRAFRVVQRVLG